MLSQRELDELRHLEAPSVVSLYLDMSPSHPPSGELKPLLKQSAIDRPELTPALERLAALALSQSPGAGQRGLAAFWSEAPELSRVCSLPQPVKSQLRVATRPYLAPLVNIAEQYQRYGVLLLDQERCRFFEVFLGRIEELLAAPVEPSRLQDARHRRLAGIAAQALELARRRAFERLVIGGEEALSRDLIGHLAGRLQDNLIMDPKLGPELPAEQVLAAVSQGQSQSRAVRESVLVHRLLDARAADAAVVGLAETLQALRRGDIRLLLVRDGLAKMGRLCPHCGALMLSGRKCVYCWLETQPVIDLIGEMIQQALDSGAEFFRILHDRRLDPHGGVGAELRFPLEPSQRAAPAGR